MTYDFDEILKVLKFKYLFQSGEADCSFGIHCAKSVGIPQSILENAELREKIISNEGMSLGKVKTMAKKFNKLIHLLD
jgi:DNA mismatch repair ATPase MutS